MRSYGILAAWSFLAGAGIPLIGVLNSGVAKSVGNPFAATAIMFAVAMIVALGFAVSLYGVPTLAQLTGAPKLDYAARLAQLLTAACVDQFGLFGMMRRPVDMFRFSGLLVIAAGIAIMEIGNLRNTHA